MLYSWREICGRYYWGKRKARPYWLTNSTVSSQGGVVFFFSGWVFLERWDNISQEAKKEMRWPFSCPGPSRDLCKTILPFSLVVFPFKSELSRGVGYRRNNINKLSPTYIISFDLPHKNPMRQIQRSQFINEETKAPQSWTTFLKSHR